MVAVAINKSNGKIFESQNYQNDKAKVSIENSLKKDAQTVNLDVDITYVTDSEFEELMSQ
jgi:hypothetical protein